MRIRANDLFSGSELTVIQSVNSTMCSSRALDGLIGGRMYDQGGSGLYSERYQWVEMRSVLRTWSNGCRAMPRKADMKSREFVK